MDVIVVGLGGMGSAIAAHLARRGHRVVGLDRFEPPHERGSSHGLTRIIRQAYFEGPAYVPLLLRAYELWRDLEQRSGRELMRITGGLMIGPPGSEIVTGARESAQAHGLAHELLGPAEVVGRFPAFRLQAGEVAVYEPPAGVLFPEEGIAAHLDIASEHGADLRSQTPVNGWSATDSGVRVTTPHAVLRADRLVIAAGAWSGDLLADAMTTTVERMVLTWFHPPREPQLFDAASFPVFVAHHTDDVALYGMPPRADEGVKVAFHHGGRTGHPDALSGVVDDEEIESVRDVVRQRFPQLGSAPVDSTTCFYTNSRDGHFVIGEHPRHPQVVIAGGFSGHGFKFCPVVGEAVADLVDRGSTDLDLSPFSPTRSMA